MQRVFTKPIGRYERGQIADYPRATWDQIAVSAKIPVASFSAPITEALNYQSKEQPPNKKVF